MCSRLGDFVSLEGRAEEQNGLGGKQKFFEGI